MKNRRDRIALLLFAALVVGAAVWTWQRMQQAATTPGASTTIQRFEVAPGSSMRAVLRALERQQLISDARMLELYLRCCQRGTARAGSHGRLAATDSPWETATHRDRAPAG